MAKKVGAKAKDETAFYRFVSAYQDYMNVRRDYGNGELYSMVEMHILAIVCTDPGITVGEVAHAWGCTKGAASQNITKLEKKGLLVRTKLLNNAKEVHIYPTKAGEGLTALHREYDRQHEESTGQRLLAKCTMDELETFNKVMRVYADVLKEDAEEKKNV